MKDLLGGKGANLAEMTSLGLPVPPGFTITTEVCTDYYAHGSTYPDGLDGAGRGGAAPRSSRQLGTPLRRPRRARCWSRCAPAPRVSMPGMMDTVLNLGLNDATVAGPGRAQPATRASPTTATAASSRCTATWCSAWTTTASRRALDDAASDGRGVALDTELDADDLARAGRATTRRIVAERHRPAVPAGPAASSSGARSAPCSARWMNDRAPSPTAACTTSPTSWGTAVNVQAMVFGNMGDDCATGVAFTRNPSTGENALLRRVPGQRPGRGRGGRHPHAAAADRAAPRTAAEASLEEAMPEAYARARARCCEPARSTLPRHAGHRVHDPAAASSACCRPATASAPAPAALQDRRRHGRARG